MSHFVFIQQQQYIELLQRNDIFEIEINAVRWPHQPHSWFGDIFDYPDCVYVICERHANCVFIQHVNKIKIWFTNAPAKWVLLIL